jgi:hypothetical protein
MGKNTNHLREKADELFRQEKFNEIIELLTDNVLKIKVIQNYMYKGEMLGIIIMIIMVR